MKNSEIEKKIREESKLAVPDLREKLGVCAEPPKREDGNRSGNLARRESGGKSPVRRPILALCGAAVFLAVCLSVVLPLTLSPGNVPPAVMTATVRMKINPSVELVVKDGATERVRALNPDALILLKDLNVTGLAPEEACLLIADAAKRSSFLTEAGIGVLVAGKDEAEIRTKIQGKLEASYRVNLETPGDSVKKDAEKYGISPGKMQLAYQVLEKDPKLKIQKLVKMDSEDLLDLLEEYDEALMERFEELLEKEYESQYAEFLGEVRGLLTGCIAELEGIRDSLDTLTISELNKKIHEFNKQYEKLGEDFELEIYGAGDEPELEDFDEMLDEARSALEGGDGELAELASEMFEDWLDEFKSNMKDKD